MCYSTAIKLVLLCSLVFSSCAKAQRLESNARPPISTQNNQITSIPVDVLLGGGILLQARVNDSGPLQFALDSAIDGKPAFNFTLDKLYQMFKQEGQEYVFSILRIQKRVQIKIKLRRLV
jgi:hypothetical protein